MKVWMSFAIFFVKHILCILHIPFYIDEGCKAFIKKEILTKLYSGTHLTITSVPNDDSDLVIFVNMKKDKDIVFSLNPINKENKCFINKNISKKRKMGDKGRKQFNNRVEIIIKAINNMDQNYKKKVYLSIENCILFARETPALLRKEALNVEKSLLIQVLPSGSAVSYYPDIFNKYLEQLYSSNIPKDYLFVFPLKDAKILYVLSEGFFHSLMLKIRADIKSRMYNGIFGKPYNYTFENHSIGDLISYYMIDIFKKMDFNDVKNTKPYIFSLIKFLMNKKTFESELEKIISTCNDRDIKIMSEKLNVFDFPHFYQDENVLSDHQKEMLIGNFKVIRDLKNVIYFLFYTISQGGTNIRGQSFELISIILSHIQKAPQCTIEKIFLSENIREDGVKDTHFENELQIYLKKYFKSFSEYLKNEFESGELTKNDFDDDYEGFKGTCLHVIEQENLKGTNVMDEKIFESLKQHYKEKLKI